MVVSRRGREHSGRAERVFRWAVLEHLQDLVCSGPRLAQSRHEEMASVASSDEEEGTSVCLPQHKAVLDSQETLNRKGWKYTHNSDDRLLH